MKITIPNNEKRITQLIVRLMSGVHDGSEELPDGSYLDQDIEYAFGRFLLVEEKKDCIEIDISLASLVSLSDILKRIYRILPGFFSELYHVGSSGSKKKLLEFLINRLHTIHLMYRIEEYSIFTKDGMDLFTPPKLELPDAVDSEEDDIFNKYGVPNGIIGIPFHTKLGTRVLAIFDERQIIIYSLEQGTVHHELHGLFDVHTGTDLSILCNRLKQCIDKHSYIIDLV